jgi:hypothetical protein
MISTDADFGSFGLRKVKRVLAIAASEPWAAVERHERQATIAGRLG